MDIYSAADRGGNSAWKGFSSQTIYIANRLIFEKDKTKNYYPESIEDLKITDTNGSMVELIQVKNLSNDLSLSDLKPQKEGSFFKRALDARQQNTDLLVRLISYGDIGPELLNWSKEKAAELPEDNITTKLESYGYSSSDIEWLREYIDIEKKDEADIEELIFTELEKNIETSISPGIIFDILVNYVSRLSRHQMSTSKMAWQEKVRIVSLSLASISGWKNQFGKTILPLSEYQDFDSDDIDLQRKAYENGVSALSQHILNNFDILRPYWLDTLKKSYNNHNIAILHGASGQGKSSLAYRYLIDNYASNEIFVVSGISSQQQAIDISAALRELQKNEFNLIIYIDVRPYDKNWVWLIEQIYTLNLKMPVLVTIREEDYNRNPLDRSYIQYSDIEITLNEMEARDLYERYPSDKHLSFEDSWEAFGEYNLLMEYIFFLRENESLKSRLQTQIDRLTLEEENIDNWLLALLAISYAGRKEVPLNVKKLLKHIEISNYIKMLQVFNKEYWTKSFEDNVTLSSLHPVRAMLLCDILFGKLIVDEGNILLQSIQFTDYYPQTMLIDYFYNKPVNPAFLEKLSDISFSTWATYAGVIESLLWLSVWQYYKKYEAIIDEGNSLMNNAFAFIMITDITSYLNVDTQFFWNMLKNQNPIRFQQTVNLINSIEEKSIDYYYVDEFMKKQIIKLPLKDALTSDSLTHCGFALFWHAQRDVMIEDTLFDSVISQINYSDILSACEFCLGVQKQKWGTHYNLILKNIKPLLTKQLNIVYLDDEHSILHAYAINDISTNGSNHTKTMLAVDALRLLYCEKDEYHITLIGSDILKEIPVLDNTKTIKNDKLPYKWITRLNGWFINIDEYKYLMNNWKDVFYEISSKRQKVLETTAYLNKAIDEYFKRKKVNKFTNEAYLARENQFKTGKYSIKAPRCATNKYGMSTGISNFADISSTIMVKKEQPEKDKEYSSVIKAYNDYIQDVQNFLAQKEHLLIDKINSADVSNNGRLSYVNLMFALEHFPKMLSLFNTFFAKYIPDEASDTNEQETIFLLGIMWEHVYKVPSRIENSVLYTKKRELSNQRDKILNFIEEAISNIFGVQEVVYTGDKEVFILLELLYNESFIEEFYLLFTDLFKEFDYATVNYALVASLVKKINVQFCYNSVPTIGGFQISNLDFTKTNKQDFFASVKNKAIGFDNYYWNIPDNKIKYILTITGLIESFTIIQKHIEDILKYLSQIEHEEYLVISTINNWKLKCDSLAKNLFTQIRATCETLLEYLDNSEQKDILHGFIEVTNSLGEIDDLLLNLAVTKDAGNEFSFENYRDSFTGVIDFLVAD